MHRHDGPGLEVIRRAICARSMVQVAGVDVHEDRHGAGLRDGFGGGDERVGHGDDLISRPDAGRHQGKAQGVGAGVQADAMPAAAECCELFLESRDLRPSDEGAVCHDLFKDGFEFAFDLAVLGFQIKERDLHGGSGGDGFVGMKKVHGIGCKVKRVKLKCLKCLKLEERCTVQVRQSEVTKMS